MLIRGILIYIYITIYKYTNIYIIKMDNNENLYTKGSINFSINEISPKNQKESKKIHNNSQNNFLIKSKSL